MRGGAEDRNAEAEAGLGVAGSGAPADVGRSRGVHTGLRGMGAARAEFEAAQAVRPTDVPCELFIKRCLAFEAAPPASDWDAVS
jgi:hypothetical protein